MKFDKQAPNWAKTLNCGITICDAQGVITYMNDMAISMKKGDLTGRNVMECHNSHSQEIISRMLERGGQHVYTIEKNDVRKLLYQSSWLNDEGKIGGYAR